MVTLLDTVLISDQRLAFTEIINRIIDLSESERTDLSPILEE